MLDIIIQDLHYFLVSWNWISRTLIYRIQWIYTLKKQRPPSLFNVYKQVDSLLDWLHSNPLKLHTINLFDLFPSPIPMFNSMLWYAMVNGVGKAIWWDLDFNPILWDINAMLWDANAMICYCVCFKRYTWNDFMYLISV